MNNSMRLERLTIIHFINRIQYFAESAINELKKEKTDSAASDKRYRTENAMDRYGNSVLRMAYSYLHNMSDAEDILQETMIKYIRSAPVFESARHEKAWLLRVCANLSKNKIEYNKYRETDELNESLVGGNRQDLSFVWEAVKSLSPNYRAVVHLYYYEGYSTKEVAKILLRNESSVRSDLKRAKEKLKRILKEEYDFE